MEVRNWNWNWKSEIGNLEWVRYMVGLCLTVGGSVFYYALRAMQDGSRIRAVASASAVDLRDLQSLQAAMRQSI